MPSTGQFYANEQLTSGDLQSAVTLLNNSFTSLITRTLYANAFTILNGLTPSASSTADGGVQIASGLAYQDGQTVLVAAQQGVNILPGSYPNGTGLAADATYNRIDVVYIIYAQGQTNLQTRSFAPPNETPYTASVYTEFVDGWTLSVVHGVASATPAVPSAPSGSVVLAQVLVPAAATTITSADITDETAVYRNDGGRLALATNGLLNYVSAAHLGTPAGMKLGIGATSYLQDNTTSGRLDIYGSTNGVSAYNPWYFRLSGTSLIVQPTTDAAAGTHMQSFRNASGTEYAWVDNGGNLLVAEGTFGGLATFNAGLTVAANQTLTNNGTYAGSPLVTSLTATNGLSVSNPTSPGAASYSLVLNGTSLSNGASGLSLNLGNANTWTAAQQFPWTFVANSSFGQTAPYGQGAYVGWGLGGVGDTDFLNDPGTNGGSWGFYIWTGSSWNLVAEIGGLGRLGTVRGVPTSGNFGVATVVAYAYETELTGTGTVNVCVFTPTVNGLFEVRCYFRVVTGTTTVNVYAYYTDATATVQTIQLLPSTSEAVGDYSCLSVTLGATTGGPVVLVAQASVANQVFVSGTILAF